MGVPVIIGNCVTYDVAMQLMRAGAAGVMVGIGPGAACTSVVFSASAFPRQLPSQTVPRPGLITSGKAVAMCPSLRMEASSPVVTSANALPVERMP